MTCKMEKKVYFLTREIATIIQSVGGSLFGGYVRDKILHDNTAKIFYKYCIDNEIDFSQYNDKQFMPELKARFIIPKDIDCFMNTTTKDKLLVRLKEDGYKIQIVQERKLNSYISFTDDDLQITTIMVSFKIPEVLRIIANIKTLPHCYCDIVHTGNLSGREPPFGDVDFECNAMIMSPSGDLRISKNLEYENSKDPIVRLNKLNDIITDICKQTTHAVKPLPHRFEHLMKKHWNIKTESQLLIASDNENQQS